MDKRSRNDLIYFLILQLFLPLCTGLGWLIQRPFQLTLPWLEVVLLAAVSIFLTRKLRQETASRWLLLLLPASIANGLFLLQQGELGGIAAFICIGCGWVLLQPAPKGFPKGCCYLLCALACAGLILILPLWGFAQIVGSTRILYKERSPGGRYTAIVSSIDQGALGGDTVVQVRDNQNSIHILLGQFVDSTTIWTGGWGDHEGMALSWEDETTLQIHGINYRVTGADAAQIAEISHTLGAEIKDGVLLEHQDTHGGFHGDGSTFVKIRGKVTIPDSRFWHDLPAPEEIIHTLSLRGNTAPEYSAAAVKNGKWFFLDRHTQSMDPASFSSIHQRGSWNFTLAVWDETTETLTYFEFDT